MLSEINRSSSILKDIFDDSFTGIHVDDKGLLEEVQDYLETIAPKKKTLPNSIPAIFHFREIWNRASNKDIIWQDCFHAKGLFGDRTYRSGT